VMEAPKTTAFRPEYKEDFVMGRVLSRMGSFMT